MRVIEAIKEHGFTNFAEARKWAKENIVGAYHNREIGDVNISGKSIDKYLSGKAVGKSQSIDAHLSTIRVLPQLIENSIIGDIHEDRDSNSNLKDIVRLYGAIDIEGTINRVKITVKRYADENTYNKAYSYEVLEIEPLEGTLETTHTQNADFVSTSKGSITSAKLLKGVENSKGLPILNSSKVVDENGEPKVVYHGTNAEFDIFDASHNHKAYKGFFFTDSETMGSSYGKRTKPSFLNIKDAFVIDGHGRNWNDLPVDLTQMLPGLKEKIKLHQSHFKQLVEKGKMPQESYDYWDKHYYQKVAFIEDASKNSFFDIIRKFIYAYQIKKFDASDVIGLTTREIERLLQDYDENANIIFRNITDYGPRPVYWDGAHDVFVVTNPNDIRPANSVDVNEDDIAFSIIGEKGASALDRADEVTHRMDNLNIAREMETTGKDAKAIRLATGWERGADGKWRYEIEDIEIKNLEPLIDGKYATLGDVVDGTIFQAYPQLKDIPIDTNTSNGDSGSYDSSFHVSKGTIELGEDFIRSVLVHEIQHAIQSIEGWSGGKPSPNDKFFNEMRDRHKVIMDILSNDYNEAELRNLIKQEQDKAKRLIYFEMYEFMRDGMSMDDIRKFYMDEYDSLDRRQREARKEYLNASGEVESRNAQKRMDMSNEQRRETLLADTEDVAREDQIFLMENSGDSEMAEGNLFQYFAGTLSELISRAKASAQGLIKKVIAPVSSRLKDDLAQQGVELDDNYKHVIDNNAIRHTLNNHSGSSEEKRGQIPVTESDFDRIEDVVENYDSIVVDNGKRGNINILYSKTYADGTTIYIEEKRNKRKELAMVTMWQMKNSTLTDANRSETTPIPDLNEVSTGKDTTTSSNTQQNGELFKRGDIYDYKTGDKITMQNVNVALYREHGPYGQALKQNVSFRGVVLGWGKDYQIDAERLNENLDKALIILEEYKEHLTSLKSNATTPAQKVIDEQIAKIDASMDWANQTKENPSLFHERRHNAPLLELLRPMTEEVINAEFPDNPSVVAQQTAEALGVDIEIDETLPAKGSYNTRTGRIRINPHRHSSPQDIERTILHEVIGHGGLQALSTHRMPHTKEVLTKKTAQKIAQYNF